LEQGILCSIVQIDLLDDCRFEPGRESDLGMWACDLNGKKTFIVVVVVELEVVGICDEDMTLACEAGNRGWVLKKRKGLTTTDDTLDDLTISRLTGVSDGAMTVVGPVAKQLFSSSVLPSRKV